MKNKLAKIVAVLTVVGLMSAGPVAYAMFEGDNRESGKGYKQGEGKGPMQGPMEGLDLTPSQQEEFMALSDPARQERDKAIEEQMKTKMQALDAAVAEPGITLTDVSDLIEEIGTLQAQVFSQKMGRLFAMKKILPPEQFAKKQEMDKRWMNKKPEGSGEKNRGPDQEGSGENNQEPDQE